MRQCFCNRVHSDRWSKDQCEECWMHTHVRSYQRGDGKPQTGRYARRSEALAGIQLPLVCIHEGNILELCTTCNNDQKHVRECELHGTCTRGKVSGKAKACSECPDHRRELFPDYADPLPTYTAPHDEAAHIKAFRHAVEHTPKYPGDNGERGIIWTCHSPKFWLMTLIAITRLRELGCTLPVEVWYRSSCGKINHDQAAGLDVRFRDRDEMVLRLNDSRLPLGNPDRGGWEVKTYAATHTRLARFWILDSDALFVADPTCIIPDTPFGYWIDLPYWKTGRTNWAKFGLENHDELIPQVQGGHLWCDKQRAWKFLTACHWANEHSDYFYAHSNDDQSIFRAVLAEGGLPYQTFDDLGKPGGWVQRAHICRYEGQPLITHYCQGKLFEPDRSDLVPGDRERLQTFGRILLNTAVPSGG